MFLGTLFCLAFLLTLCHAFVSSSSSDGGIQRQHRRKCSSSWSSSSLNAFVSVVRDDTAFNMYYTYVERKQPTNGASRRLPVVTLHGGPGLPSDYLLPLQDAVLHRSMLFYDQLGCGKSDAPRDESKYSIEQSLDDLVALLKSVQEDELGGSDFHLYGHSFGGVLAYEYLKRERPVRCRSVVLSSAPASIRQSNADWDRLQSIISETTPLGFIAETKFRQQHVCRKFFAPKALGDAYLKAGKVWSGTETESIRDYEATTTTTIAKKKNNNQNKPLTTPPALLIRGEHDFVLRSNLNRWKTLLVQTQTKEFADCSHHCLLEQPTLYGETLDEFWTRVEA